MRGLHSDINVLKFNDRRLRGRQSVLTNTPFTAAYLLWQKLKKSTHATVRTVTTLVCKVHTFDRFAKFRVISIQDLADLVRVEVIVDVLH